MWEQEARASHVGCGWPVKFKALPGMIHGIQQCAGPPRVVHAKQSPAELAAQAFRRKKYPT